MNDDENEGSIGQGPEWLVTLMEISVPALALFFVVALIAEVVRQS